MKMKPRTVLLTLELRDCREPLRELRRTRRAMFGHGAAHPPFHVRVDVAQATATVAQPSTTARKPSRRRGRK